MFQPKTDLGIFFSDECRKLNDYFSDERQAMANQEIQAQTSHAVFDFFNTIGDMPKKIETLPHSLTVLFELDQAINGMYGIKLFSETNTTPMRKLLRDIMALWFRYKLLAELERKNGAYLDVMGIRTFYEDWITTEQVGIDESEYDRILSNVAMLLENSENLVVDTRVLLFNMLGDILVTLGISAADAENNLLKYNVELKDRSELSITAFAEVLLSLNVFHVTGTKLGSLQNINYTDLHKVIRYWSSTDTFAELLFKSWNVYWENDYFTPLNQGEEMQLLNDKKSLLSVLRDPQMKIGIGQSFIEFMDHKLTNQTLTSIFKPIPIFAFGYSGVGKTAFLTSFCYDVQMRSSKPGTTALTLGREFQSYYQSNLDDWRENSVAPTGDSSDYTFWEDLNINSYKITDYAAKKDDQQVDDRDQKMNEELLENYRNSRSLMFFLGDTDYTNPSELRRKASMFDSFLQYWMQSNPEIKHIPISLVLTKADQVFGHDLSQLSRPSLIPPGFRPEAIDTFLKDRITSENIDELQSPYGRFKDCILNDKSNNNIPGFQDVVQILLDNFEQFFNRVLEITYNYQIFIVSSAAPMDDNDQLFPYGVREPISWQCRILEKTFIDETLATYTGEEEIINNKVKLILEDVKEMNHLKEEIDRLDSEISYLQEKSNLLVVLTRDMKIKGYQKSKQISEDKLAKILKKYDKTLDVQIADTIKEIEQSAVTEKDKVVALNEKRRNYENRKAALESSK